MRDPRETAKAAKKAAKAEQKAIKKTARLKATSAASVAPVDQGPAVGQSPAERSADAAEQQVALRWRQVWISLAGVIVALLVLSLSISRCSTSPTPPVETETAESRPVSPR